MKVIKVIMAQINSIISNSGLIIVKIDIIEYCNINLSLHFKLIILF
jgi:hypothetical protein